MAKALGLRRARRTLGRGQCSDNSSAEDSPPPRSAGGPSLMYTIDVERSDQNSAGRYPLISRPTQISMRVGVVQVIRRLP
jgi:hypothetical protein